MKNLWKRCVALGITALLCVGALGACANAAPKEQKEAVEVRIGSLKGPTTLGILDLMERAETEQLMDSYQFQMATAADELLPLMVKGELDLALVPANVAAVLYQKTEGKVCVIDINTYGVLYLVTGSAEVKSVSDLKGKTIYLTGKGATPEASLKYILETSGLTPGDYTLEYKSEATEVAAVLADQPGAIGLLPQPFVTAALMQNSSLQVVLDLNQEWKNLNTTAESGMVTGVTVVRKEFLQTQEEAVKRFLQEHRASVEAIQADVERGAALAVKAGIVAKEPIAQKAIPKCNLACVTGEEMKTDLSGYLKVLENFNAQMIGGKVPEEDFYYIGK